MIEYRQETGTLDHFVPFEVLKKGDFGTSVALHLEHMDRSFLP